MTCLKVKVCRVDVEVTLNIEMNQPYAKAQFNKHNLMQCKHNISLPI